DAGEGGGAGKDGGAEGADEDRKADPLGDGGGDALAALDRAAEIAMEHLPEPLGVLDDERVVQVILLANCRQRRGIGGPRAEQGRGWIAGRPVRTGEAA